MSEFTGKRVVVMGGSRGIGRAAAIAFARAGASVAICARGAETLEATRKDLEAAGAPTAYAAPVDLARAEDIARFIPAAADALGGINVLVNNASGFAATDDDAGWAASFNVDMLATVRASQAALPYLERAGDAAIVNVSSISALRATKRNPPYAAIKAAIDSYTASQARILADRCYPRQRRRPRLHRVPRRRLGPAQVRQPRPLRCHPGLDPLRPHGPARGSRRTHPLPCLPPRQLDHRPKHRRRRRPTPRQLTITLQRWPSPSGRGPAQPRNPQSPSFTNVFPKFFPFSMPMNAFGAVSSPSLTSSRCLIAPLFTSGPISPRKSASCAA